MSIRGNPQSLLKTFKGNFSPAFRCCTNSDLDSSFAILLIEVKTKGKFCNRSGLIRVTIFVESEKVTSAMLFLRQYVAVSNELIKITG
jgi:hypothetical protein